MMKTEEPIIRRGDVKRFREYLNEHFRDTPKHQNGRYQQKTRPYGDYLYAQDRDMFQFEMREWLASLENKSTTADKGNSTE
jgi:hypothetical protein